MQLLLETCLIFLCFQVFPCGANILSSYLTIKNGFRFSLNGNNGLLIKQTKTKSVLACASRIPPTTTYPTIVYNKETGTCMIYNQSIVEGYIHIDNSSQIMFDKRLSGDSCNPSCSWRHICMSTNTCKCSTGFIGSGCTIQSNGIISANDSDLGATIFLTNFGYGSDAVSNVTPSFHNFTTTLTQGYATFMDDGFFAFVLTVNFGAWIQNATDHTDSASRGYMFLINAAAPPQSLYRREVTGLSIGTCYEFSAYVSNIIFGFSGIQPSLAFEARDGNNYNNIVAQFWSGNISGVTTISWKKYGVSFTTPIPNITLTIISIAESGAGNDLVMDDISLRCCRNPCA